VTKSDEVPDTTGRRTGARWAIFDKGLDEMAARRSRETAVVILSPRND
jgi:hypothetical protein